MVNQVQFLGSFAPFDLLILAVALEKVFHRVTNPADGLGDGLHHAARHPPLTGGLV